MFEKNLEYVWHYRLPVLTVRKKKFEFCEVSFALFSQFLQHLAIFLSCLIPVKSNVIIQL
jgi:hypothetical protein